MPNSNKKNSEKPPKEINFDYPVSIYVGDRSLQDIKFREYLSAEVERRGNGAKPSVIIKEVFVKYFDDKIQKLPEYLTVETVIKRKELGK